MTKFVIALLVTLATSPVIAIPSEGQPNSPCDLSVIIDISGSLDRLDEAWSNVLKALPDIVVSYGCDELVIYTFDVDGWALIPVKTILLPAFEQVSGAAPTSEWLVFENIRGAAQAAEQRRLTENQNRYERTIAEALQELDHANIMPPADHESAGTDVLGVLLHVSHISDPGLHLILLITDLTDTYHRSLPSIPPPQADVRLLILLAPAKPKDSRMAFGEALPSSQQFERRLQDLHGSVPWAKGIPYFSKDIAHQFPTQGAEGTLDNSSE